MTWAYVAIAAGSVLTGVIGSQASKSAASTQANAANQAAALQSETTKAAIAEQQREYDTSRSDFAPFRQVGISALDRISQAQGLTGNLSSADRQALITSDPVYQASYESGLKLGRDAIMKAAAARGGLGSPTDIPGGGILKDLTAFGSDYTSQKAGEAYNRLLGLVGVGQGATSTTSQLGANAASGIAGTGMAGAAAQGAYGTSAAAARAAGIVGGANAWNSGLSQGYNLYNSDRIYGLLANRNSSAGGGGSYYIDNTGYDSRTTPLG